MYYVIIMQNIMYTHTPTPLAHARRVDKAEILKILKEIYQELHEPLMRLTNDRKVNTCRNCKHKLCKTPCVNSDFARLEDADYDLRHLIYKLENRRNG